MNDQPALIEFELAISAGVWPMGPAMSEFEN
jgi:hypothetical protein